MFLTDLNEFHGLKQPWPAGQSGLFMYTEYLQNGNSCAQNNLLDEAGQPQISQKHKCRGSLQVSDLKLELSFPKL